MEYVIFSPQCHCVCCILLFMVDSVGVRVQYVLLSIFFSPMSLYNMYCILLFVVDSVRVRGQHCVHMELADQGDRPEAGGTHRQVCGCGLEARGCGCGLEAGGTYTGGCSLEARG